MGAAQVPYGTSGSDSGIDAGEDTLFGALTRSTSVDVNDLLGLPALPSDNNHISLLPHKVRINIVPWTHSR